MKKFENLGRKLSKEEKRKIIGGDCYADCFAIRTLAIEACWSYANGGGYNQLCVDNAWTAWQYCMNNCGEQPY